MTTLRAALIALAAPTILFAQAKPRAWGGNFDLGYVASSGNTSVKTFSLGEKFVWKGSSAFTLRQEMRSIYGEAEHKVNASLFDADITGDYSLFDGVGVTASAGYDRNRFAGIAKRFEESVGFLWRITTAAHDTVRLTGGILWTQQENVQEFTRKYVAFRGGFWYKRPIREGAYFQEAMEGIPNITNGEDWRFNAETALIAAVTKKVGLKMSYLLKYDHLPEPTYRTTDRIFTTGLQITY